MTRARPSLIARSAFETGAPRRRRIAQSAPWTAAATLLFDGAGLEAFEQFIEINLAEGVRGFVAPDCADLLAGRSCWIVPASDAALFTAARIGADAYQTPLKLEVL